MEVAATRVESGDPDAPWELVASARDISKRMQALAALDESQSRLRAVADNMPALIVHIDADERYTFINAYYERLFGRKPEELLGRTIREARGEEAYREWAPFIHRALDGEEQKFERDPSASSGGRYLQSHFVPDIAPDGARRGLLCADVRHHAVEAGRAGAGETGARGYIDGARESAPVR